MKPWRSVPDPSLLLSLGLILFLGALWVGISGPSEAVEGQVLRPRARAVYAEGGRRSGRFRALRGVQRSGRDYFAIERADSGANAAAGPGEELEAVRSESLPTGGGPEIRGVDKARDERWEYGPRRPLRVAGGSAKVSRAGSRLIPASSGQPTGERYELRVLASGPLDRLSIDRRDLREGITLAFPPLGGGSALVLALDGELDPEVTPDGGALLLHPRVPGGPVVIVSRPIATDRDGRRVPSRFAMNRGRVRVEVDDREARHPVRVESGPISWGVPERGRGPERSEPRRERERAPGARGRVSTATDDEPRAALDGEAGRTP